MNTASVTYPNPLSTDEQHTLVNETLDMLYGDKSIPELVYTDNGGHLLDVCFESPTVICVRDRCRNPVAYWIGDRLLHHIATKLNGVWREDCLPEPMDLSIPVPEEYATYALGRPEENFNLIKRLQGEAQEEVPNGHFFRF